MGSFVGNIISGVLGCGLNRREGEGRERIGVGGKKDKGGVERDLEGEDKNSLVSSFTEREISPRTPTPLLL